MFSCAGYFSQYHHSFVEITLTELGVALNSALNLRLALKWA